LGEGSEKVKGKVVIHPVLLREGLLIAVLIKRFQKDGIGSRSSKWVLREGVGIKRKVGLLMQWIAKPPFYRFLLAK